MIDEIYCINLKHRIDRMTRALDEFKKHDIAPLFIEAVDGRNPIFKSPACDSFNNACTLSHIKVLKDAKSKGHNTVMIFEDDVILHKYFQQNLNDAWRDLPIGWDMLYLGGTHKSNAEKVTDNLYEIRETYTTHGYIIRRHLFDEVIEMMSKLDRPVDCYYIEIQKRGMCYVTNPPLAWQRKGYSDLCHRDMDYPWLETNEQKKPPVETGGSG